MKNNEISQSAVTHHYRLFDIVIGYLTPLLVGLVRYAIEGRTLRGYEATKRSPDTIHQARRYN